MAHKTITIEVAVDLHIERSNGLPKMGANSIDLNKGVGPFFDPDGMPHEVGLEIFSATLAVGLAVLLKTGEVSGLLTPKNREIQLAIFTSKVLEIMEDSGEAYKDSTPPTQNLN